MEEKCYKVSTKLITDELSQSFLNLKCKFLIATREEEHIIRDLFNTISNNEDNDMYFPTDYMNIYKDMVWMISFECDPQIYKDDLIKLNLEKETVVITKEKPIKKINYWSLVIPFILFVLILRFFYIIK